MNRLWIPMGLSTVLLASTGCQGTTPWGEFSIGPSPVNHSVTVQPNAVQSPQPATSTGHPECDRIVANNTWVMLHGQEQGSKVNVRPQPSINAYDGSYGLVGESVKVLGSNDDWYWVRFPQSGHEGWLHCSVANDPKI